MSQLAISDFFILCHSGCDGVTCSVPWVTVAWRTHQSNPEKTHMLTCSSSYFWFYVPTTQETITSETTDKMSPADVDHVALLQQFKPRLQPLWGGASEPWSDQCPKWSPVLKPKYQTCLNLRNPDGINRQWKPADQKTSPKSCWRIWRDICRLLCLQISRVLL